MTITKNSLVNLLHDEVGLNKREAKEFIETFFEVIKLELENGNDVKISGFWNFNLRDKRKAWKKSKDRRRCYNIRKASSDI